MHDAIKKGNRDIIKALLDCDKLDGSKANKEKLNVMHVAAVSYTHLTLPTNHRV